METRGRDLAILELAARPAGARSRPVLSEIGFDLWQSGPYRHFVRAVGYGYSRTPTANTEPSHGRRLYADIAVARARCRASDASFGCVPGAELVAAGHPSHGQRGSRPDTCGGDSGGPIYALIDATGRKEFVAVGVTSRGIDETCGAGGIYSLLPSPRAAAWSRIHGATVR